MSRNDDERGRKITTPRRSVCKVCGKQFNERTEDLDVQTTDLVLGKSDATIMHWEQRLAA